MNGKNVSSVLWIVPLCCWKVFPFFETQFRETSQKHITTKTTTTIYAATKNIQFELMLEWQTLNSKWDLPCSLGLCLYILQEQDSGQTDPVDTDCMISFRMISVSHLERLVSRADIRQTAGRQQKDGAKPSTLRYKLVLLVRNYHWFSQNKFYANSL